MITDRDPTEVVREFQDRTQSLRDEIHKVIVGHTDIVDGVITCLLAGGHVLLEGVPGLGKTRLVRALAQAVQLEFSRIQFTPDLMPADILGTTIMVEDEAGHKHLQHQRGPVFAHIVLADEINRATPKTQSALLEAMQEQMVTLARTSHPLEDPFFVLATQNPLEMEGTYPLPEAQLDRFLYKLEVGFPNREDLHAILDRTTGYDDVELRQVLGRADILAMRRIARDVAVAKHIKGYVIRLLEATHPKHASAPPMVRRFVRFGASPRGAQACLITAKIRALFDGRFHVSTDDVRGTLKPALRHRLILNFEGEAEGIGTDRILDEVVGTISDQGD